MTESRRMPAPDLMIAWSRANIQMSDKILIYPELLMEFQRRLMH